MDGKSLNLREENIKQLNKIFPDVFSDGKIDLERLKDLVGENSFTQGEHYELTWIDKTKARQEIQKQTKATLKTDREGSIDFDTAQNIFIEGDNLEVLKILQKSYFGKIKMIYIDPPYNTGQDFFVYPDNYGETEDEYLNRTGAKDDEGNVQEMDRWYKNSKDSIKYHSSWLSMMYPRLYLARNLLREDGVLFIHIDNNEVHNLKMLLNEIFGEENFIECINWNKRVPKNDKGIGSIHEYIFIYVKDNSHKHEFLMNKDGLREINDLLSKIKRNKVDISEGEKQIKKLYKKRGYDRGLTLYNSLNSEYRLWGKINLSWPNSNTFGPRYEVLHPITGKPVKIPDRGWRWKKESFDKAAKIVDGKFEDIIKLHDGSFLCGRIWFDKDENTQPSSVNYLDESEKLLLRSIISLKSNGGIETEKLFEGKSHFSYPKPTSLAKRLISSIGYKEGDLVLDFFAGSSTTAQAILELNEEDGGHRNFIMVQINEKTEENSAAKEAGYNTISDISKIRIQKVIKKLKQERVGKIDFKGKQELSFAAYRYSSSNFKQWNEEEAKEEEGWNRQLEMHLKSEKEDFIQENMVVELILKNGYELTVPRKYYQPVPFVNVWSVNEGEMWIYLDEYKDDVKKAIVEHQPKKVIFLNSCFQRDKDLANLRLELKELDIQSVVL